eukprot:jgi/Bigna1/71805/fgenesh1_pg.17_\
MEEDKSSSAGKRLFPFPPPIHLHPTEPIKRTVTALRIPNSRSDRRGESHPIHLMLNGIQLSPLLCLVGAAVCTSAYTFRAHESVSLTGSFRKDIYLEQYTEAIDYNKPTDGGRVHVTVAGSNCRNVTSVLVNGQEALNLPVDNPDFKYFDWTRLHQSLDGSRIWFSFHSRNNDWLGSSPSKLNVTFVDNDATCYIGELSVKPDRKVLVTYVTTQSNGKELVVHTHNNDKKSVQLEWIEVNGIRHDASKISIGSGQTYISTWSLSPPISKGDIWTVSLGENGESQGWGGRVVPERFPIQAWPLSDDCPFPGLNDGNANELLDAGIDSVLASSSVKKCGDMPGTISKMGSTKSPMNAFVTPKILKDVTDTSNVDVVFLGDEVDGKMDSNLRTEDGKQANEQWPHIPTYQGAKTSAHIGSYSGITDIQGMDAYCAACAPTIIPVIKTLPLQYPYQYLRNARDNHAPLPTYLYSQLYSEAWSYQANENEIIAQIGEAIIAGAKGLTLFQSSHKDFKEHDFSPIKKQLRSIAALRESLRTGDVGGLKFDTTAKLGKEAMIEVIRSPKKVIVIAINTRASGYSNTLCHVDVSKHWNFDDLAIDSITLKDLPVKLSSFAEVADGKTIKPSDAKAKISSGEVKISKIKISSKNILRFFTFDVE